MNQEDFQNELLISRATDLYYLSLERQKPQFTNFLNEQEISVCLNSLNTFSFDNYSFFGGYSNSQRKILGFSAEEADFPISIIEMKYRKQDKLTHSQILGTVLSTGIKRNVVGDIICKEGVAYVFILSSQANYVVSQIDRVARVGVKLRLIDKNDFDYTPTFKTKDYTVASLRLDNIVAAITGLSRERTRTLILSKTVFRNYIETDNVSAKILPDDVITIRKYGKYIIEGEGTQTKKGRIRISIKQYI